jgi:unsaturated chondroitin disaccharide hydrolase
MKQIIAQNQRWIDETWQKIDQKLRIVAVRSRDKLPYTTVNGVHDDRSVTDPAWWTNGFWGGMMWLMYHATGNEDYSITARRSEKLLDTALTKFDELHHDVGFMWHLTSGAAYRLTGDQASRLRNLYAAATLASRYNVQGDYIQAWNGEAQIGYSIIDCLMNIPLLYWASRELEVPRFRNIAIRHMDMSLRDHIRPDGSVNHIVDHYRDRIGVKQILAGQGYSPDSCWSRGLAWAIYGSVLSYIHAGKDAYLDAARRTADFFLDHCRQLNYLPTIDFLGPQEPVYYDATAGLCAACGILELAKYVPEEEARRYTQEVICLLQACCDRFCDFSTEQDAIVIMGSERYPHDDYGRRGLHMPIIYGDFFLVEALTKLRGSDFLIW